MPVHGANLIWVEAHERLKWVESTSHSCRDNYERRELDWLLGFNGVLPVIVVVGGRVLVPFMARFRRSLRITNQKSCLLGKTFS